MPSLKGQQLGGIHLRQPTSGSSSSSPQRKRQGIPCALAREAEEDDPRSYRETGHRSGHFIENKRGAQGEIARREAIVDTMKAREHLEHLINGEQAEAERSSLLGDSEVLRVEDADHRANPRALLEDIAGGTGFKRFYVQLGPEAGVWKVYKVVA